MTDFTLNAGTSNVIITCNVFIVNASSAIIPNTSGGGSSPGGINTSIQYNNSGLLGGSNTFNFDYVNHILYLGNSSVNVSINSTMFSGTSNNTLFVGLTSAANVVSNAQLQANLANYTNTAGLSAYQTLSGLAANVLTLTANNTNFVGTVSAVNVVSNAQLIANLASYVPSIPASYVQNTDSRVLSGNLTLSAVNINFSTGFSVGNSTVNSVVNSTIFTGTSNNSTNFAGQPQSYYANVTSPSLSSSLSVGTNVVINTSTIFIGNTTVNTITNSTSFTGTANNSLALGGFGIGFFANIQNPVFTSNISIGTGVYLNTSALFIGNSTVNDTVNSTVFSGTSNNTLFVGTISAANVVSNAQLQANLANYTNTATLSLNFANVTTPNFSGPISVGNSTVNVSVNSTIFTGTAYIANNSTNFAGQGQAYYANISSPVFSISVGVGANVLVNTSTLEIGNSTVNTIINSTAFQTGNSSVYTSGNSTTELFVGPSSNLSINNSIFSLSTNITINTSVILIGNTTVNASMNSSGFYIGGAFSGGGGYYLGNQGPIGAANNVQNLIRVNANTITANITMLSGQNGNMTGPITITGNNVLTIQTGARLVVI
jgi:hypothetical protein